MTEFTIRCKWQAADDDAPAFQHTMADLAIFVGKLNLMINENTWSQSIRDSALLSAYPLAMWIASSWWRLNFEPLPAHGISPAIDWRMSHELGAADHGFICPMVIFASDGDMMQVWAGLTNDHDNQSIRYLNSMENWANSF